MKEVVIWVKIILKSYSFVNLTLCELDFIK